LQKHTLFHILFYVKKLKKKKKTCVLESIESKRYSIRGLIHWSCRLDTKVPLAVLFHKEARVLICGVVAHASRGTRER